MKNLILLAFTCAALQAQGYIRFECLDHAFQSGSMPLGLDFSAQLYAGPSWDQMEPYGADLPFWQEDGRILGPATAVPVDCEWMAVEIKYRDHHYAWTMPQKIVWQTTLDIGPSGRLYRVLQDPIPHSLIYGMVGFLPVGFLCGRISWRKRNKKAQAQ